MIVAKFVFERIRRMLRMYQNTSSLLPFAFIAILKVYVCRHDRVRTCRGLRNS